MMMEPFDMSRLPEQIAAYTQDSVMGALRRNSEYLARIWGPVTRNELVSHYQALAQYAMDATSDYLDPRVDMLEGGDDPRLAFYESDMTEPVWSYAHAWVEGYATRANDGQCSEGEVRPLVESDGIDLTRIDNRIAYAETVLPRRGYREACVSFAIGHAILNYARICHGDTPGGEEAQGRFNWMGDIDGFADGWSAAAADGFGHDDVYVPYSEEQRIDELMEQVSREATGPNAWYDEDDIAIDIAGDNGDGTAGAADDSGEAGTETDGVEAPADDMASGDGAGQPADGEAGGKPRDATAADEADGDGDEATTGASGSLPDVYSSILSGDGTATQPDKPPVDATGGMFLDVTEDEEPGARHLDDGTGDMVFTAAELSGTVDATGSVLRVKTVVEEAPDPSVTGPIVSVVAEGEDAGEKATRERVLRRIPPQFAQYLLICVSRAMRGNASRFAEIADAGMTDEQRSWLRKRLTGASAKYGKAELAAMGMRDGLPIHEDGTDPVLTYACSWLQGYLSVVTDGDFSQAAIVQAAIMGFVDPEDIEDDIDHAVERQEDEGYGDDCTTIAIAHLRVSLASHSKGHPLAHPLEGSRKLSRAGLIDGFSDGWWFATRMVRKRAEALEAEADGGEAEEQGPQEGDARDMEQVKREAKAIMAGLFDEGESVSAAEIDEMVGDGVPVPQANPAKAQAARSGQGRTEPGATARGGDDREAEAKPEPIPMPASSYHKPTKGESIRNNAIECTRSALAMTASVIRELCTVAGMGEAELRGWANAVSGATASYGKYAYDNKWNPFRTSDGKLRMGSYAVGWIYGYAAAFGVAAMFSRLLLEQAQRLGITFGDIGDRFEYVRRMCESNGYGRDNASATIVHLKEMYVAHSERNPEAGELADATTYYWVSDADGFSDGWSIAQRVRAQREQAGA